MAVLGRLRTEGPCLILTLTVVYCVVISGYAQQRFFEPKRIARNVIQPPKGLENSLKDDVIRPGPGVDNGGAGNSGAAPQYIQYFPIIAKEKACADDISRICSPNILDNNLAVLDCVQNYEPKDISDKCHNFIWQFKYNLTQDNRFEETAKNICPGLVQKATDCKDIPLENKKVSHFLYCLMDHQEDATDPQCRTFLIRMEAIVFSDYRLIYKFADACENEINRLQCGRVESKTRAHTQGQTIDCLAKHLESIDETCRQELLHIVKLQGEDFHLDRTLFFACREDRERFCNKVQSGEGHIYRCLLRHRTETDMSTDCKEQLIKREKLAVQDYRVNRGLVKACRDDIKMYKCRQDTSTKREFRLAQILLCLENAMHNDYPVAGECKAEMLEHRRFLMENYHLTPDLATACEKDIGEFCQKKLENGGKTLHCLMKHAKPQPPSMRRISDLCRRQLEMVLKEVDIGADWRVDPVLQETCQSVVDVVCKDIKSGRGRVLSCLMNHLNSYHMSDSCKETLLQIQYFIARDFKLDPALYQKCRKDAEKYCHAKPNWHDKPSRMDPERGPIVLPCLYRYAYHPDENVRLGKECLYEIKRVMKQRAASVDLHPEIEEPCLTFLGSQCSERVQKGEEMQCLQDNLDALPPLCREAVANYTEEEAEHLELNYPLFKACGDAVKKFCGDLLSRDVDQGDLMQCLISHKNDPEMKNDETCRISLEHFQLLSLKDYRFSYKFKEACKKDVLAVCRHVKTKAEVVTCLSGHVLNDTVLGAHHRISPECRRQLKVELLQREENVHLDPELDKACSEDQHRLCSNVSPGEGQMLECLRKNRLKLSPKCHRAIFQREKQEMQDNSIDYALMTVCKPTIKKFCAEMELSKVLSCLAEHRRDPSVDDKCRSMIQRRLVEQNSDYRLNVRLKQNCQMDIVKFCSAIIAEERDDMELEGKVIHCLKSQYLRGQLTRNCEYVMTGVIRDVAKDLQLDPILAKACKTEVQTPCPDEQDIEECLKTRFQNKEIKSLECKKEVARLIYEGKADVQSDPILYKACIHDIKHFCAGLTPGRGKLLSCLLTGLESETVALSEECRAVLSKRVEMFEYAAQVAPVESLSDVVRQIASSPSRNYIVVVALGMLGVIFIGGLFCGRVTKRVPASIKNK